MPDDLLDFVLSPTYAAIMRNSVIVSLLVAGLAIIVAFAHYGRAREALNESDAPWTLLIGTMRDSFILTLLYTVDALIYRASDPSSLSKSGDTLAIIAHFISIFGGLAIQFLIIGVATLRVVALTRWLRSRTR